MKKNISEDAKKAILNGGTDQFLEILEKKETLGQSAMKLKHGRLPNIMKTHIDKSILVEPNHSNITLDIRHSEHISPECFNKLWEESKEWISEKLKAKGVLK